MLKIELIHGWVLAKESESFYNSIHTELPTSLYSEVDYGNGTGESIRYWPIYFPIGMLIEFATAKGWPVILIY